MTAYDRISKFMGFDSPGPVADPREATRHRGTQPWHVVGDAGEPAFQNGWVNDASFYETRFLRDDYGLVHITSEDMQRSVSAGSVVFTLPVGFRPPQRLAARVMVGTSIGFANTVGRLDILTNGQVVAQTNAKAIGLTEVRFRVA